MSSYIPNSKLMKNERVLEKMKKEKKKYSLFLEEKKKLLQRRFRACLVRVFEYFYLFILPSIKWWVS